MDGQRGGWVDRHVDSWILTYRPTQVSGTAEAENNFQMFGTRERSEALVICSTAQMFLLFFSENTKENEFRWML